MTIELLTFDDFVGNKQAVAKIHLMADDASKNSTKLPHMAFLGPAGNGKTTMARIVSDYIKRRFVYINSVAVKDALVFRGLITHPDNMKHGSVIVLDECHRLPGSVQDHLLSVLESPAELVTVHKGVPVRDKLPDHISFIFATTHAGYIRDALLSRLEQVEFHEYTTEEKQIIAAKYLHRTYGIKGTQMEPAAIIEIGRRARSGRHVVRVCDNIIRFLRANNLESISKEVVTEVFRILGIDLNGLTARDKILLGYLAENGRCGIDTLEAYLNTPKRDIREKIEPYLLRAGLIERQSNGRAITPRGMKALKGDAVDI
jgi:Holliday junction DNA helicase RuvB